MPSDVAVGCACALRWTQCTTRDVTDDPVEQGGAELDVRRVEAAHEADLEQPTTRRRPRRRRSRRDPSIVVASGFSHSVGLPAARHASASSSWSGSGAAIRTASTSSSLDQPHGRRGRGRRRPRPTSLARAWSASNTARDAGARHPPGQGLRRGTCPSRRSRSRRPARPLHPRASQAHPAAFCSNDAHHRVDQLGRDHGVLDRGARCGYAAGDALAPAARPRSPSGRRSPSSTPGPGLEGRQLAVAPGVTRPRLPGRVLVVLVERRPAARPSGGSPTTSAPRVPRTSMP